MLSEKGLESCTFRFSESTDLEMSSILMHNTFNKDKIKTYKISGIDELSPMEGLDIKGTLEETLEKIPSDKWYIDELKMEEMTNFYE